MQQSEAGSSHYYPPIGVIKTCFTEKFGVPRQSLMVPEARGILKLNPDPQFAEALNQLETFSHLWLVFAFHLAEGKPWRARIEPPRTDGPRTVGVFASRSPHRPNPIGMSVVKLDRIDLKAAGGIELHVSGVDLLDGTPVLDIKPYVPYADIVADANAGWAKQELTQYKVEHSAACLAFFESEQAAQFPHLKKLLEEILSWDPRPRSQREAMPIEDPQNDGKIFRFRILGFDVEWRIQEGRIQTLQILTL